MTVPLRSGLAAAGRRLDRTIRAQGQGSTVCGDRTVCYTGAAKVRRSHRVGVAFPEGLKLLPFYENLAKRQLLPFYAHSLSVTFTV